MNVLLFLTLVSVIPDVYITEDPLGSCSKNEPFRMDDGNCMNFRQICIKEESSQCKSVLNECSQCPPSGYTISMLATLNEKINELSTLRKEIKDLKNMSDSTRKQVQVLPALNEKIHELSTLTKEIINIKNMSDSSRKQVELLPDLNVTRNETLTIREEIKDLKNDGLCLKILCILCLTGIAFIIGFCIFKILRDKRNPGDEDRRESVPLNSLNCGDEDKEVYILSKLQNPGVQNKRKSDQLNSQNPGVQNKRKSDQLNSRNSGDQDKQELVQLNPLNTGDKDGQEYIPLTSRNLGDKNIQESDPLTSTPGPFHNVFGKLDETNEKLDKMMPILEKHGQDIVNINKTLVGQNQALIRQILGGRDQETNNQPLDPFGKLDETNEKLDKPLNPVHVSGKPDKRNEKLDKTPDPYDNVFGKFDEINEKLNKMLNTLAGQNKEMIDQIISVLLSTGLSQDKNVIRSILDETKLDDQKPEQIPSPAVPEGVGGSNTKQITSDKPEYHSYKE